MAFGIQAIDSESHCNNFCAVPQNRRGMLRKLNEILSGEAGQDIGAFGNLNFSKHTSFIC